MLPRFIFEIPLNDISFSFNRTMSPLWQRKKNNQGCLHTCRKDTRPGPLQNGKKLYTNSSQYRLSSVTVNEQWCIYLSNCTFLKVVIEYRSSVMSGTVGLPVKCLRPCVLCSISVDYDKSMDTIWFWTAGTISESQAGNKCQIYYQLLNIEYIVRLENFLRRYGVLPQMNLWFTPHYDCESG